MGPPFEVTTGRSRVRPPGTVGRGDRYIGLHPRRPVTGAQLLNIRHEAGAAGEMARPPVPALFQNAYRGWTRTPSVTMPDRKPSDTQTGTPPMACRALVFAISPSFAARTAETTKPPVIYIRIDDDLSWREIS